MFDSCHLLDRKDHQHVLNSGPGEAYQVREYFRAEYVKII